MGLQKFGAVEQALGGNAARVQTDAARVPLFDQRYLAPSWAARMAATYPPGARY